MIKKLILPFFILFFGLAATAWASEDGPSGTVLAVEGSQVQIEMSGDLPSWARKGGYLRAVAADGQLILRGAKIVSVEGKVITVTSTKAAEMKVGDRYTLGKGKASAGC